ncbi:hypothetical protein KIL84_014572 [Mauremys mutica]|uniref:Uncharacterized protein n=1 Tax=Mauremys mutica TaxID=74926 RepID=A0A9D3XPY3_9SAUR|nr:hypothetical protein KIL84_014572 [Mauremys mutica]
MATANSLHFKPAHIIQKSLFPFLAVNRPRPVQRMHLWPLFSYCVGIFYKGGFSLQQLYLQDSDGQADKGFVPYVDFCGHTKEVHNRRRALLQAAHVQGGCLHLFGHWYLHHYNEDVDK